ncbi:hypothetical protein BKA69DRAFT_260096 [Paraphysoderma sedebokerense]|nr:hypothetical protein BKA69DRAFT_260096 [Paraphysoderma sedebokerense]
MSLNVTHQIMSTLSLHPEPSSSPSSSNLSQMVPPEPSALTTSIMTAQNDDYIEMNPAVSTSLNRSSSTSSPNLFANSEPQTVNSLTTGITSQITVTSPNPLHSSNRNSSGRRRLSYENNNSSVMSNSQVTENSSLYHHHPNIQHPMLNTVIPGGASSPSLFPLPTTRSNNGAVSNLSASSSSNGTNTMISIADAILLSNDYKIPSDNHSAHSRGMNSSQQNTLGQSLTNQLSSMSLGFEPSFAPNSHENYTYLHGKASTSPRKGVARQLRKNQPNITTQPVTTEKSIVANSPHVNHADSDDRAEVVDEKDEFFRVVGVKPSSHPQNSRVSVYIAPIPAPAPLQSPARTSQTSPPPPPTVLSAPSRLESLKEIDTCKIDTSKILVRFTTGDSGNNGTNEKTIQAEWKGRARRNEVYGCSRRRELLTFGATSSDKSGTVPFNTLCKAAKLQSIYLAADLRDAGLFQGGLISSLSLKISDVPDRTIENFRIACSFTSDDHFTEFMDPNELAVVFGPTNLVQSMFVVNEWISFELIKPIEWDGRSNLVLELSKDEVHSSFSWPATGGIYFV